MQGKIFNTVSKSGKIIEPFFATQPADQGTVLVLSLANDLVKTYGGKIKVGFKERVYYSIAF